MSKQKHPQSMYVLIVCINEPKVKTVSPKIYSRALTFIFFHKISKPAIIVIKDNMTQLDLSPNWEYMWINRLPLIQFSYLVSIFIPLPGGLFQFHFITKTLVAPS